MRLHDTYNVSQILVWKVLVHVAHKESMKLARHMAIQESSKSAHTYRLVDVPLQVVVELGVHARHKSWHIGGLCCERHNRIEHLP